jgi:hypothetical protein
LQNASPDQLLPQQMVVKDWKLNLEHGKFLGAKSIVFKDCLEI